MELSIKEGIGLLIATLCTTLVIIALYKVGYFNGIISFIEACTQNSVVTVTAP